MQGAGGRGGAPAPGGPVLLTPDNVASGGDRRELVGAPKKRGPIPQGPDQRDKRIAELERETARWRQRAERAEALVEVQKKLSALLEAPLEAEHS